MWKGKPQVEGSAGERPCRNPGVKNITCISELSGDKAAAEHSGWDKAGQSMSSGEDAHSLLKEAIQRVVVTMQ